MFVELYWKYFFAGIFVYVAARVAYTLITRKSSKNSYCHKKDDDVKSPDQLAEAEGSDNEQADDEFEGETPSLPADLPHVPLNFNRLSEEEMTKRATEFFKMMNARRTVRHFSPEPVPREVIQNAVRAAGTAPSGAHTEPWTYVAVWDQETKARIREIVEWEEEVNYRQRMARQWTADLRPLRTNWVKEYLTEAPCVLLLFRQQYGVRPDGKRKQHYYSEQSTSIAAGLLLAAIHYAGLVSLTSTPLNCGPQLRVLLNRPASEKLSLLLPVGYPAKDCLVPDLTRKPLEEILIEV